MNSKIGQAFEVINTGYSTDRVVADPELNQLFLRECRRLGLREEANVLNRQLLNLRKGGDLKGRPRSRTTTFSNAEEYRFASEMAVRFLERRDQITLDDILCDPAKAIEFDKVAGRIAPGYSPLQYRWAALNLRKKKRLRPEILGQALPSREILNTPIDELDPASVPISQGLYIFYETSQVLYVGEASNLRKRIEKHLDHSDNKGLARWMWEHGQSRLFLELQMLESKTTTRVRRALEAELIRSRRPVFNFQGH